MTTPLGSIFFIAFSFLVTICVYTFSGKSIRAKEYLVLLFIETGSKKIRNYS